MSKQTATPETVPGMGAIITEQGTAFRVWAPHAKKMFVTGNFAGWDEQAHELTSENNDYWYGFVEKAKAGDEYKFCVVDQEGNSQLKNDPYAKVVTNSVGNSIITDPAYDWEDDNYQLPSWNDLVIYELHTGTFNVKKKGRPGNFKSLIEKLPYLQKLGISAIELLPVAEFPGDFSWGYNPAHPFAVEENYGKPSDLKDLIKAAHQHGIGMILDVVYNHFGPSDLDMWRFDGWGENDGGGIYFYNDWRADTPWGSTRPDYGRPEVQQYIRDNAIMWLDEYRFDGLRLDGTMFMRNTEGMNQDPAKDIPEVWEFFQSFNQELSERFPNKIIIAEDLMDNHWITKSTDENGAGFDAQWWSDFVHPVRSIIIEPDDEQRNMDKLAQVIQFPPEDAFKRVIYTESHDEVANGSARVPEEIWPEHADSYYAKKRSFLGAGIAFTAPGIPMMFQGQEFAEDHWFSDDNPLNWDRAKQYQGITQMYTDLIKLRRDFQATTTGLKGPHVQVYHKNKKGKVIAYQRWQDGGPLDTTIVMVNLFDQTYEGYTIGLPQAGDWQLRFNSDWKGYNEEFTDEPTFTIAAQEGETDGMPYYGLVDIGPYTVLVFSQNG